MSFSMKIFLLGAILMSCFRAPELLQEYTGTEIERAAIINYFLVFSVVFFVALKGAMFMHIFGLAVSFIKPNIDASFRIQGTNKEVVIITAALITVMAAWFIICFKYDVAYPHSITESLLLPVMIAAGTKIQTMFRRLQRLKAIIQWRASKDQKMYKP